MSRPARPVANVLGVSIDLVRLPDVLERIQAAITRDERQTLAYIHASGLCLAREQPWLREFLNACDLAYCDGMGVMLGARLLGERIPERLVLTDWSQSLVELAAQEGYTLYFLGNPPGAAERAARVMEARYPGVRILGCQDGFFDKSVRSPQNLAVIANINQAKPDILLVGFGMPAQERWLAENRAVLETSVVLTAGALFEYLAGDLRRGPRWMTEHYLEWLARILISPRRYWKRYLRDNLRFLYFILRQKFAQKSGSG
ncbi:MAG: WecB/TagA/CpsF family glycosyltransferase [Chloroflexota bacterium]